MEYKFKVGDKVKIVRSGFGCNPLTIDEIVTITELGVYNKKAGYKIDNDQIDTNTKSGSYDGYIGEKSFELVERRTFSENDIVVCLPKPLPNPGNKEPNNYGGAGYKPNLCFQVTSISLNSIAWNDIKGGIYFPSLRHATEEEKQRYYDLKKPYITTEEIFEKKSNRFNIGDIVDTNNLGWQYTNMKVYSQKKDYDEQTIFINCGCRSQVLKNIKILDVVYSPYTKCWWYQLEGFNNWYSEHSLVVKEKENENEKVVNITLGKEHIGKFISFYYYGKFYNKALVTEEVPIGIYLLNNCYSNNDGHKNKSEYKHSLFFSDFEKANEKINSVTLLSDKKEESGPTMDLLEEAKRRYPVGTKYKCANNICVDSIVQEQSGFQYYGGQKDKIDMPGNGFIYYKGKWAEIISTPDLDEKTKLEEKEEILQKVNSKNYYDYDIETSNPCAEIQMSLLAEIKKVPVIQNKKIEILREPVLNKRQKKIKKTNKINLIIK